MIVINHSDHIADKYYDKLNLFGLNSIIPVVIGLFIAKHSTLDAFLIQTISAVFLSLSLLYLVNDSSETTKSYNRIAKQYVKKYKSFTGHLILVLRTSTFLISFIILGTLAFGLV